MTISPDKLPDVVIFNIISFLKHKDECNLRITCKTLSNFKDPRKNRASKIITQNLKKFIETDLETRLINECIVDLLKRMGRMTNLSEVAISSEFLVLKFIKIGYIWKGFLHYNKKNFAKTYHKLEVSEIIKLIRGNKHLINTIDLIYPSNIDITTTLLNDFIKIQYISKRLVRQINKKLKLDSLEPIFNELDKNNSVVKNVTKYSNIFSIISTPDERYEYHVLNVQNKAFDRTFNKFSKKHPRSSLIMRRLIFSQVSLWNNIFKIYAKEYIIDFDHSRRNFSLKNGIRGEFFRKISNLFGRLNF